MEQRTTRCPFRKLYPDVLIAIVSFESRENR
jgi:hypothetical protein